MTHIGVVTLCAAITAGCDAPAGPSSFIRPPTPAPVASPNPVAEIRVTGRVIDDLGRPVPGATIAAGYSSGALNGNTPLLSSTDGTVEFRVAGWSRGLDITVAKEGYENSNLALGWPSAKPGDTVTTTFPLHAIVRIPAGESVRLPIVDERLQCAFDSESYPACRSIRITTERAGRLFVKTADPFLVYFGGWATEQFHVDLDAAREVIVQVVLLDPPPGEATIATRLEAQRAESRAR